MRTFSEVTDALASQRNIDVGQAASYVNMALEEANSDVYANSYQTKTVEIKRRELSYGSEWHCPVDFLAALEVVYDTKTLDPVYRRVLGQNAERTSNFYYQAGNSLFFSGQFDLITLAYRKASHVFIYYPPELRLVRSSDTSSTGFEYRENEDKDADWIPLLDNNDKGAEILNRHTNWILTKAPLVILSGAKSYQYNDTGNPQEGGRMYSAFANGLNRLSKFVQ